jgi:hypothetical protein
MNPFDPQTLIGSADPAQLLAAAAKFPGGAAALIFALFWAPAEMPVIYLFAGLLPGIPAALLLAGVPAGVVLAQHAGINPLVTFGLYTLSDILGAACSHPIYVVMRRLVRRVPALHWFAKRMMRFAMLGARAPRAEDINASGRIAPALFRIGTVGFGMDVYKAGMLVAGLPVPRVLGWTAAILGDLVWFAILLVVSIATAAVVDDYRIQFVVMVVAMFVLPYVAERIFPVLRQPKPERAPRSQSGDETASTMPALAAGPTPHPALAFAAAGGGTVQVPLPLQEARTAAVAASYAPRITPPARSEARRGDASSRAHGKAGRSAKKPRRR